MDGRNPAPPKKPWNEQPWFLRWCERISSIHMSCFFWGITKRHLPSTSTALPRSGKGLEVRHVTGRFFVRGPGSACYGQIDSRGGNASFQIPCKRYLNISILPPCDTCLEPNTCRLRLPGTTTKLGPDLGYTETIFFGRKSHISSTSNMYIYIYIHIHLTVVEEETPGKPNNVSGRET